MTKLSEMILEVRARLSDIPEEHLSDLQVYNDLKDAKSFVDQIAVTTATEDQLNEAYKSVATVYSYVNWTSLAERLMGTQPTTSFARVQFLREKALARLQLISKFPLNRDLTLDFKSIGALKVDGAVLADSILEEYDEDAD